MNSTIRFSQKRCLLVICLIIISCNVTFASNIFVDNKLTYSISNGTYSIVKRNSSGSDGNAFPTIQAAVNAMTGGDAIYVRGGTYNENVYISQSKNGSFGNYSSIQSYAGEWAIINGGNNANYTIGHHDTGSLGANDRAYWKFERLEITGGTDGTDSGAGIKMNGGPFIVRYCYVHDNIASSGGENPGGVGGYCWRDSLIEYNRFKHNGTSGGDNGGDIMIMADYRYTSSGAEFNSGSYKGYYYARNVMRYNLFDGGSNNGVRQKSAQDMVDDDYSDMTYKAWGDKIHHNIFFDQSHSAVQIWQDFVQVYNNITNAPISLKSYSSGSNDEVAHAMIYNNTIMSSHIKEFAGGKQKTWTVYTNLVNNIVENFGKASGYSPSIHYGAHMGGNETAVTVPSKTRIEGNYVYRPKVSDTWLLGGWGDSEYLLNTSEFDSKYSRENIQKDSSEGSDNLFQGTSGTLQYKTRGSHIVSGKTTIANGGAGESHPYLTGVSIPSYIGATNPLKDSASAWKPESPDPDDSGWVNYVLSLNNVNTLKNSNGISSDDSPAPSFPVDFKSGFK